MADSDNNFLTGFILGGLIGAGIVFLFGTEKGGEVRKDLKGKGEEALDNLDEILEKLEERGVELQKKAIKVKKEAIGKAMEVKEEISENVVEGLDNTLEKIEALQERGREATAALRKKYFVKDGKRLG